MKVPACILWLAAVAALTAAPVAPGDRVSFNRDVRPILSDRCFQCHGPDEAKRFSGLRLDTQAGSRKDLGGRAAIVPGDPANSVLLARVRHEDEARRMPPVYAEKPALTPDEIATLERWIEQGAEYEGHWAFIAPQKPAPPEVSDPDWARSPIDRFVLAKLDAAGRTPSPEAENHELLRRVTLDLTGLPPTLDELDAFLKDNAPGAYERAVDRLLDSPRYGERMAIRWLDAARYADTNGYQTDAARDMYRWRDWVIQAFNQNKPFDEFTIEQIAGDLLPDPTLDQIIATGFNRNHRANSEGGIVPEEYLVEYGVDRVETFSTVWMGLTLGCTRCHDHKFDPFSQKEFYQLYSYFMNIPERGRVFKFGNTPPLVRAPTREQQAELAEVDARLTAAEARVEKLAKRVDRQVADWKPEPGADWFPKRRLAGAFSLGENDEFDGERQVSITDPGGRLDFRYRDPLTLSAWVRADAPNGAILAKTDRDPSNQGYGYNGWGLYLVDGKLKFLSVLRWVDDGLRVATKRELPLGERHHVAVTYDGSGFAEGAQIYVDGEPWEMEVELDSVNQEIRVPEPALIGRGGGLKQGFQGRIDDVRVYDRDLDAERIAMLAVGKTLDEIAATPAGERSAAERRKLRRAWVEQYGPEPVLTAYGALGDVREERLALVESFPTVMVMQELPEVQPTYRLERGQYDAPAEQVGRGLPEALPPMPEGLPRNRLGLAKWLVSREHPLTARVAVNRFWQMFFGRGLVKTVEDFGSQGEWPTHPDLLDWLAVEFMDSAWDVKRLVKTIVTSSTYRQSSDAPRELRQADPENALLARGPRMRLPAEMVRDQALAISGLLVEKIGGPSVKPYQPPGLWEELSGQTYRPDSGDALYRRSLYTFWKRSAPPPFMMNFDSAGREACTVNQTRTNTPLQALNLMNDVTYVEAARMLAERMLKEAGPTPEDKTAFAFRLATARRPDSREQETLVESFEHYCEKYRADREAALALLSEGAHPRDESLDPAEHAAYTVVASLILNLDEVITKE